MAGREKKPVVASKTLGSRREKLLTSTLRKYNSLAEAKKELLRLSQDIDPVVKRPVGRPRKHDLLETCSTSGDSSTSVGPRTGRLKKRFSRISGGLEVNNGVGRNSPYSFRSSQGLLRNGKRRTLDGVDFSVDFTPSRRRRISSLCGSVDDLRPVGRKPGRPSSGISAGSVDSSPFPKSKVFVKKEPLAVPADKPGRPSPSSEAGTCDDDGSNLGRHISSRIAALIKKSKVSEILQKYTEAKASRKAAAENEKKLMDTNSNLCTVTMVSGVLPIMCDSSVTKEKVKVEDMTVSSEEVAENISDCPVKNASEKFVEYKTEKTFNNPTESATSLSTVPASGDKAKLKSGNLCDVPAGGDVAPPLTNKVQDLRVRGNVIKSQKTVGVCNLRKAARKRILKVEKINSVKKKLKLNKNPRKVVNNNQRTNLTAKKLVSSSVTYRKPRNLVRTPFRRSRASSLTKIKTEPLFTNDKISPDFVDSSDTDVPEKADGDNCAHDSSQPSVVDISVNELSSTSPIKSEVDVSGPYENNYRDVEDIPVCTLNGVVAEAVVDETKDEDREAGRTSVDSQGQGKESLSGEDVSAPLEPAIVTKDDAEVNCDVEGDKVASTVLDDAKELFVGEALSKELICECDHTGSGDNKDDVIQGEIVGLVTEEMVVNSDRDEERDHSKCYENGELGSVEAVNTDEGAIISSEIVKYLESKSLNVVPVVNLVENDQSSESEDGVKNLNGGEVSECQIPSLVEMGLDECIIDVGESLPQKEDTEIEEILLSPAEDKTCPETEGVATGSTPESEITTRTHVEDKDKLLLEDVEDLCGTNKVEAAENVSLVKLDQHSNSKDTSPADTSVQQSKHKPVVRRRRSAAVKEKKQRNCLKRSLSAECTNRDTLENNQRRAQSGCESSKAPETTYIIISKEKEGNNVNGTDFEITVGPDENGSADSKFEIVKAATKGGSCQVDEVTVGEVETVKERDESAEALDSILDKLEATEGAKAVEEESAEAQAVKESVLRALGLTSWRAAQEAVARQGGSAKNSSSGDGETYTGTLKTVIKVQRSPEKRRRSLKMVLKHCSTRNGVSSQIHSNRGSEDGLGDEHVEYRICKETDTSTGGNGASFGFGNRKYSKTSQGYRYLSEHDSNSSSSGNTASVEKGADSCVEPKEEGKSDKGSLVIPEKSASFSIHPGRLCSDVCSYCYGKFGSLDTPCHIAQLKSSDRQRKILEIETHLTPDSCLCDACYRHVDRKANCPSYKPTRKRHHRSGSSVGGTGGNTCSAVGCEEAAQHHVRRKWLLKLKRSISKKVPLDMEKPLPHFPFCQQHFNWIDYYMVCGICSRRLTRSHMYTLGSSEVRDLNAALVRDGIPARVTDKRFLCKLCRYYASLRAKCRDPCQLAGNQKMFFESYRKRILQYHDIEVASEPEELPLTIPKPKRKKSKVLLPSATEGTTLPSADGTSESSSGCGAVEEDRLQAGTPMIDYSNLASIGASLTVTPVPARAAPRRDEDELPPVQASFSFHGPNSRGQGASAEWERCTANLQFTPETKQLFQTLQRPYGSHSSFMRHLVLMEKFWRQGDLVLAPRASARATNYVNSVQHRLRAFDYTPTTASSFGATGTANSVSVIPVPDPPVSVVELPLRQPTASGVTLQLGGGVMQLGSGKTFLYAQPRPPRKRAPSASTVCRISEVRSLAPEQTRWSWGDKKSSGLQKIAPKVSVSVVPRTTAKPSTIVTPTGIVLSRNPEISVSSIPPK